MRPDRLLLALVPILLFAGCAEEAASPPADPVRVEHPELGIALAQLPAGFEVEASTPDELLLVRRGGPGEARLAISAQRPEVGGVNLVTAVNEEKAAFEARPGGTFHGQIELMGPFGAAYNARGRYDPEVEEARVLTLHPDGQRMLVLTYTYRDGDPSKERMNELFSVFGELEAL